MLREPYIKILEFNSFKMKGTFWKHKTKLQSLIEKSMESILTIK